MVDCLSQTMQLKFKGGSSIWNNVLYNANGAKFSGGTGISLSREFSNLLVDNTVLIEGRAQYVILKIHGTIVGILNVYAPTTIGKRTNFWNQLAQHNFPATEWIVSGDFNMTELPCDQSQGFNSKNMTNREQNAWSRLALLLGVEDVYYAQEYRKIGSKCFTSHRKNPTPCWSRLDRCYTSADL